MIFNALQTVSAANKTGLFVEELFILQTIFDYGAGKKEFESKYIETLELGYLTYFKNQTHLGGEKVNWKCIIESLIQKEWLEDNRPPEDKNKFTLSSFSVSDKFLQTLGIEQSNEDLYEEAKSIFPRVYLSEYKEIKPNFKMSALEESNLFKVFVKKILSGNKKENWIRFKLITQELYKDKESPSAFRFDKYINNFNDNVEQFLKEIS